MSHWYFATLPRNPLHFTPFLALAAAALVLSSSPAHAAALEPITVSAHIIPASGALAVSSRHTQTTAVKPITISAPIISAPVVKTIGHGPATDAPIQRVTVMARVKYNPAILTTHSGASLLKNYVADAARTECDSIGPLNGDGACVRRAIRSAHSQVAAAVTRARSTETG